MREAVGNLVRQLERDLPPHTFNTWIRPLKFNVSDETVVVEAPNAYYRERIQAEYRELFHSRLLELLGRTTVNVEITQAPSERLPETSLLRDLSKARKEISRMEPKRHVEGLQGRYVFESFVVGGSNEFAHAAARAVADSPGHTYNPLFIYGGVGLGKTHLASAIGNRVGATNPRCRVVYKTGEQFTNELINSIRFEKTIDFRSRYRESCDVLLIDDVQFVAGKERTQEEFFHTFNALYSANKQIVLTSDEMPDQIPDLDERLRSRFLSGLLADIQPPDVETRAAILKKKAEAHNVSLPDDVVLFLATYIRSNVRALEGALIRLAAFASLSGREITIELTKEIFQSVAIEDRAISVESIQKRVAEFFNLNIADLRSARRHKTVALPRQIAMYLGRKLTAASFPELGSRFGGKDHTTVMHAVSKIERLLQEDSPLRNTVSTIEQSFVV